MLERLTVSPFAIFRDESQTAQITVAAKISGSGFAAVYATYFSNWFDLAGGTTFNKIPMTDTGTDGDAVAGDGVYTARFRLQQSIPKLRTFDGSVDWEQFDIQAYDAQGNFVSFNRNSQIELGIVDRAKVVQTRSVAPNMRATDHAVNILIASPTDNSGPLYQDVAHTFYQYYPDNFDLLTFFTGGYTVDDGIPYAQIVRNDVQGINLPTYDSSSAYGSAGRLQHLISMNHEVGGQAFLHEFGHRWAAYLNRSELLLSYTVGSPHWGYSDMRGQMSSGSTFLQDNGNGTFKLTNQNSECSCYAHHNYSDFELYLMGLLPANATPAHRFLKDPFNIPPWDTTIPASSTELITADRIAQVYGARVPSANTSQKNFNAAFILVTPSFASSAEMSLIETVAAYYASSSPGAGLVSGGVFQMPAPPSFAAATGFHGTLSSTVGTPCTTPSITTQPANQTVTTGQTATLGVTAGGTAPLRYQWYKGASGDTSSPVSNATSSSFTTPLLTANVSYWVRVSNDCGSVNSGTALITVRLPTPVRPLIFIPGNPGSRLDEVFNNGPNINMWPGPGGIDTYNLLPELSLDPSRGSRRFNVTDIIRTGPSGDDQYGQLLSALTSKGGYVEYRTDGRPDRRFSACDTSQTNATLFVFPYDWRQSITKNAAVGVLSNVQLLREYVRCIQQIHPGAQVDILTHSTGGLLARRYIIDHPTDSQMNKLVTIAAPFLGAPKTVDVLETGRFLEYAGKWWLLGIDDALVNNRFQGLARYFPGVHELLPSRKYFELASLPPYTLNGKDLNYNDFAYQLNKQFDPGTPGTNNSNFHDTPFQDDWTDPQHPANTGVKYFHVYGLNPWRNTIGRVKDELNIDCTLGGCTASRTFSYEYVNGDGTVPVISAARRAQGLSLNAPGALVFRPPAVFPGDFVEHTGLVRNSRVQDGVLCIMAAQTDQQAQACVDQVTQSSPAQSSSALAGYAKGMVNASAEDEPPAQPAFYLSLRGTNQVTVRDDAGNGVSLFPSTQTTGAGLPSVTINPTGPNSAQFVIPTDQPYTIVFRSAGGTLSLELALSGDSTTAATRYKDLNLPANVSARLRLTPQGASQLQTDNDGDGVYESTVQPTAAVSGPAAQDATPPALAFAGTVQGSRVSVNINATDSGAGVKAVNYSLDGTHFQPYGLPLSLDPTQNPVVYAYAEDQVANRSGLAVYYPTLTSNVIDNAQFFVQQHYLDFLNRDPDPSGLAFWTGEIIGCGGNAQCAEVKRINVSAAFFLSIEFQQTGYLAYRAHKAAFGNIPNKPIPVTRAELLSDMQQLGNAVVVGQGDWQQRLEQNKQSYFESLVINDRFTNLYPQGMSPEQYVGALNTNAGDVLSQAERDGLVNDLKSGAKSRGQVLRAVAEDADLNSVEFNRAFVLMQYFGYLRRNPDDLPDTNFDGYNFWLSKLNEFNGNFVNAEMVKAFISSDEYRKRHGQ